MMTWKKATPIALFCLAWTVGINCYQTSLLCDQTKLLDNRISETSEEFDEHMNDIYLLMRSDSSKLYTIMDTEVRILHYAKPHQHVMVGCPECAEQKKIGEKLDEKLQGENGHKHGPAGSEKAGDN